MEIKRVDNPRYSYELTTEEVTSVKETIKIVGKILASQPMTEDGCIIFDGDQGRIYEDECNDTIDFLNQIVDCEGKNFY